MGVLFPASLSWPRSFRFFPEHNYLLSESSENTWLACILAPWISLPMPWRSRQMQVNHELCQLLDWDSAFFGFRIARLRQSELTPPILSDVFDWCDREEVRCLYFLVSADSSKTIILAEAV